MNSLKKNIIYHYIVITFVLLALEIGLFRLLFDNAHILEEKIGIPEILSECIGILAMLSLFGVFSYYYYRKISTFIKEETQRQADKRNLLFANIAHDLKNPISSVLGYARALEAGAVSEEEKEAVYRTISGKSLQIDGMIQKMFRYAKIGSEGYSLKCSPADICKVVRECIAMRYSDIEAHGIELCIDIPDEPVVRSIDVMELSRVIDNLVSNAVRHNDNGINILVCVKGGDKARIIIADSGVDIPTDMREAVFEPFHCSDESRSTKDGSGLGLAIARRIAELHGGKLYIDCNIPNYTKAFVLEL